MMFSSRRLLRSCLLIGGARHGWQATSLSTAVTLPPLPPPGEDLPPPLLPNHDVHRLLSFVWEQDKALVCAHVMLSAVAVAADISSTHYFGASIEALANPATSNLHTTLIGYGAMLGVSSVVSGGLTALTGTIGERIVLSLRTASVDDTLTQMAVADVEQRDAGTLLSALSADVLQMRDGVTAALGLPAFAMHIIGGTGYLFLLSPSLCLTGATLLPVLGGLGALVSIKVSAAQAVATAEQARALDVIRQALHGLRVVRLFDRGEFEAARYREPATRVSTAGIHIAMWSGGAETAWRLIVCGSIVGLLYKSNQLIASGHLTVGSLTSFLVVALGISGACSGAVDSVAALQRGATAGATLLAEAGQATRGSASRYRREESDDAEPEGVPAAVQRGGEERYGGKRSWPPVPPPSLAATEDRRRRRTPPLATAAVAAAAIRFEEVAFGYHGRASPVLTNVTFSVATGETVALLGASGSGKSTLGALLCGWYAPTSGRVSLFGVDAHAHAAVGHPSGLLSVLPQAPQLFAGTLRHNIAYGAPDAPEWEVERAAVDAHADEFLSRLPDGLETPVSHDHSALSGGQVQRVALARALLPRPRILLLDEPTSALDAASQQEVQEALRRLRGGAATLLITHSPQLAGIVADRVLELREGRVWKRPTANSAGVGESG